MFSGPYFANPQAGHQPLTVTFEGFFEPAVEFTMFRAKTERASFSWILLSKSRSHIIFVFEALHISNIDTLIQIFIFERRVWTYFTYFYDSHTLGEQIWCRVWRRRSVGQPEVNRSHVFRRWRFARRFHRGRMLERYYGSKKRVKVLYTKR